jgi:uncharacterized protein YpuA (DUF1002 family)
MKKLICLILTVVLAVACIVPASAADIKSGEERVVIGADLSSDEITSVYKDFDIPRGDVKELTVTNSEERTYLDGLVDSAAIGTRSISCVYIKTLDENSGLTISTSNINWCTAEIYRNALMTAGIYDAQVKISAPFAVSGTAALTGIYKAYEDITGEKLNEKAKETATSELVITSELADQIGSYDATEIVNALKEILNETVTMTDGELLEEIRQIANQYDVELTESQAQQLLQLVRQLEKLDNSQLIAKVKEVQESFKKLSETANTFSNVMSGIKNFFASVGNFFSNLFGGKKS